MSSAVQLCSGGLQPPFPCAGLVWDPVCTALSQAQHMDLIFSFQVAGDRELIWEGRGKRSLKELTGNQNEVKQVGASPAAAGGVEAKHARGNALRLPKIYCSLGRFS